jgi:hypothetical protein
LAKGSGEGARNVRNEHRIVKEEIKKRRKREEHRKLLGAQSSEPAVFEQFSFYFHILQSSISSLRGEY